MAPEIYRSDLKIILAFGLHLCRAEGRISLTEKSLTGRLLKKLRLSESEKKAVSGKDFSLSEGLAGLTGEHAKEMLIDFLSAVSAVDGRRDEAEVRFVEKVHSQLGGQTRLPPAQDWGASEARADALLDGIAVAQKIVVAEDDESIGKLVRYKLEGSGFNVFWLTDGAKALETIEEENPDLVVLDIDLPELTGFEVLAAMKEKPATKSTPVIMLTAQKTKTDVSRAIGLGANDYVVKPFRPADLLARVKTHLPDPP